MISTSDRRLLLQLARSGLVSCVRRLQPPEVPDGLAIEGFGAFVTLYCHGDLRGCLGTLDGREPLAEAIARLAGDAARYDYRFDPLRAEELDATAIDISVLSPPARVADVAEIVVGRDGLIIEHGDKKGLLLPQVAPEHGWDRDTFLAHTCVKAGLPRDAWRSGATVWRFEAEVFGDEDFA